MEDNFKQTSALFGENATLIEEMYQLYLDNPNSVDTSWQQFFRDFKTLNNKSVKSISKVIGVVSNENNSSPLTKLKNNEAIDIAFKIKILIDNYQKLGHNLAKLDPLGLESLPSKKDFKLNIEEFGFDDKDLDTKIPLSVYGLNNLTLKQLITLLERIYCTSIGLEVNHITNYKEQDWLTTSLANEIINNQISLDDQQWALEQLVKAEGFEQFLHTKFPGAKRFSIEGGESTILALNKIIELAGDLEINDIVIGMAHRGRLNALTNVMGKPYQAIISEFSGIVPFDKELNAAGDVKYHMGYSTEKITQNNIKIYLSLTPNPSHLEAVNSVVAGQVRAKQDLLSIDKKSSVMGILVHGDTAFCGQGVVAENMVMAGLNAYNTAGIIHLIVNNQIGFTADAVDAHPGRYATEVAKISGAPILHVNGEDIEAVLRVVNIAVNYRNIFKKDVVIDVICYRKYGHNEGDEPNYTQVAMYNIIDSKLTPAAAYADLLTKNNIIDSEYFKNLKNSFRELLNKDFSEAPKYKHQVQYLTDKWQGYTRGEDKNALEPETGVEKNILLALAKNLCNIPVSFTLHSKLKTLFNQRLTILEQNKPIDWATAEQLAFATLLTESIPIRMTGQDSGRGTFTHRHSVLYDQINGSPYVPLNNIQDNQSQYYVADSNLSEYAVLGFEYGYSLIRPQHLVIWEAQFGDFVNGAQIIIDQFISSAETKWLRMSGLVMLLPHAYEGQGPEHSSARLERFLQLAGENNIQIAYPTTPASIFHLLRRQVHRKFCKPLIIMSPKSLLRHKLAVSNLDEIGASSKFRPILDEIDKNITPDKVTKIICCSGKVYYDLLEARMQQKLDNIAIIRFEQLFPYIEENIENIFMKYNNVKEYVWCQEEPKNMGSWTFIHSYLNHSLLKLKINYIFNYIGRDIAASPATGYLYIHQEQQKKLIEKALIS